MDSGPNAGLDLDTACLVNDNKFVLTGPWSGVPVGQPVVIEGGVGWQAQINDVADGLPSFLTIFVGNNWNAVFSTSSLGKPLLPGLYTGVQRAPFTDPNVPGLDVGGNGAGCNSVTGQFRVIEMTATPAAPEAGAADPEAGIPVPTLRSFTATWEQHCEGGPVATFGCVHIAQ